MKPKNQIALCGVLLVDNEVDQEFAFDKGGIVPPSVASDVKEFKACGSAVRVVPFITWESLNSYVTKKQGY